MTFYTFHVEGFGETAGEFHADDEKAERAAFETSLEVSRTFGRLVFVTVLNAEGHLVCRAPRLRIPA